MSEEKDLKSFENEQKNLETQKILSKPTVGYWKDVFRRLRKNKLAMSGLVLIILLLFMAVGTRLPYSIKIYIPERLPLFSQHS